MIRLLYTSAFGALAVASIATPALAQSSAPGAITTAPPVAAQGPDTTGRQATNNAVAVPESAGTNEGLADIIVTAQKRGENLQKTPIAVQAIQPDLLARAGVKDFTNLSKLVPNLQQFQGAGSTIISLRGLRSTSFDPTDESPNAVHLDGNYIARATSINGLFYDIQRIEVLAGPQGTLFGRNAASGAVNIITNKPNHENSADGTIEAGNYGLIRGTSAINFEIADTLHARVAGVYYDHKPYFKSGLEDANQIGARGSLLWDLDANQTLLLTADAERVQSTGFGTSILAVNPALFRPGRVFTVPADRFDNRQLAGTDNNSYFNQRYWGTSLQYDNNLGFATLTLQAAHREFRQKADGYSLYAETLNPQRSKTNTAELRLTSPSGQTVDYTAGVFFFNEQAGGTMTGLVSPTVRTPATIIDLKGQTTYSGAAFGQATITPVDGLHLIVGGRFNYDRKRASNFEQVGASSFTTPLQAKSYTKLTYKVGVSYDVAPANLIYGTVSTGYKSGGFVYGPQPITPPQTITSYEVGSKNRFLDNRLQINVAGFIYDYTNFEQTYLTVIPNPLPGGAALSLLSVATAGGAKVKGVEFDSQFALTSHDRLRASVNYLSTRYRNFNLAQITGNPAQPNLTGYRFANSPHWTSAGGYTHTFDLGGGTLDADVGYKLTGARIGALPSNTAAQYDITGFTVYDASLRYTAPNRAWNLTAYASNFTNKISTNSVAVNNTGVLAGTVTAQNTAPRTYGVILGFKM